MKVGRTVQGGLVSLGAGSDQAYSYCGMEAPNETLQLCNILCLTGMQVGLVCTEYSSRVEGRQPRELALCANSEEGA